MASRGNDDVRSDHGVVAHINMGVVHHRQIKVGIDVAAKVDMPSAPVGVEGRLNIAPLPDLRKHLLQQRPLLLSPGRLQMIVLIEKIQAGRLLLKKIPVRGQIERASVHFLFCFPVHISSLRLRILMMLSL